MSPPPPKNYKKPNARFLGSHIYTTVPVRLLTQFTLAPRHSRCPRAIVPVPVPPPTMPPCATTMSSPMFAALRRPCPVLLSTRRQRGTVAASALAGRTRIGRLIESEGAVVFPGCYDALSAAIVQKSGLPGGFISGYAVSAALLGKPDVGLLTPPEMAEVARRVCASAPLVPFIADADTGGGSALNVQRTVQDLIAAGAAGCFLEDQAWPKKCGHMRGKKVVPPEEHAVKIAAAREAVGDQDFFIVARTDARSTMGLADAIARANLYMDAGADGCFVEAPRNDDELREIARKTRGYRVCNMLEGGTTPLHTRQELMEMGFHLIKCPLTTVYATARALVDILKTLKDAGTTRGELHRLTSFEEFNNLVGLESWNDLEARFSSEPTPAKVAVAVGAGANGSA